ncbi:MAG: hypothetical protein QE280_15030 [Caulobacter sp.]|nr:hypothetical protein [Caulobacter sp.]
MSEIYRSAGISCRSTHVNNEVLVISVSIRPNPNLDAPGWLSRVCQRDGYSALDILNARRLDFPREEVSTLLPTVYNFAKNYKKVLIYGHSIAAYAALNFAPFVGAKIAVAASPLFSPDPAKVPFERRWQTERRLPKGFAWDNMVQSLNNLDHAYLLYDPHDDDDHHVKAILEVSPSVTLIKIPFGGHPVSTVLAVNGNIFKLIADIAHDRFNPKIFRSIIRESQRQSPRYFETLAKKQPRIRDELRVRLLEKGLQFQHSATPSYLKKLIPPLIRQGRVREAKDYADLAVIAGAARADVDKLLL